MKFMPSSSTFLTIAAISLSETGFLGNPLIPMAIARRSSFSLLKTRAHNNRNSRFDQNQFPGQLIPGYIRHAPVADMLERFMYN